MSHVSVVYGCIQGPSFYVKNAEMNAHNRTVLTGLPSNGGDTLLPRSMFTDPSDSSSYEVVVTAFGASYNHIEHQWKVWLEAFEGLLQQLYWDSADVHLETEIVGTHHYRWELGIFPSDTPDVTRLVDLPLMGKRTAHFFGGPRDFHDILR